MENVKCDNFRIICLLCPMFCNFSATKSNYAHMLTEYVTAQEIGEGKVGPGECFPYYKKCPKSIFKSGREANKYRFVERLIYVVTFAECRCENLPIDGLLCFFYCSHILSDEDSDLDDNLIDLDETEKELTQSNKNKNKETAQSIFNM